MDEGTPGLGERWRRSRPTKKLLFWACVWSMVATMIVGFGWGGWTTGGKAQYAADGMARAAVAKRLAPICVLRFKADPARDQKLKELIEVSSYGRSEYVQKQGWATMPGEGAADSGVAEECVKLLAPVS